MLLLGFPPHLGWLEFDQALTFPTLMEVSRLVKNRESNSPLLQEILEGKIGSKLLFLFNTTLCTAWSLRAHIQTRSSPREMTFPQLLSTQDSLSEATILLKDFTVDLVEATDARNILCALWNLPSKPKCLIADIQSDLLPTPTIEGLKYIADTTITVLSSTSHSCKIHVAQRIAGGRLRSETNQIQEGLITKIDANVSSSSMDSTPTSQPLPMSTFDLSITEQQAKAKASVDLPHLRVQLGTMSITPSLSRSRPILADDYDEEDPDDDLDV